VYARIIDSGVLEGKGLAGSVTEVFQSGEPWEGNLSVAGTSADSLMVFWDNEVGSGGGVGSGDERSVGIMGAGFDAGLKPLLGGPQAFGENLQAEVRFFLAKDFRRGLSCRIRIRL
jgi:hypothetical protein